MEPRHVTLLVNPASGRGRAGRAAREAQDILVSAGMRADLLEGADAADAADAAPSGRPRKFSMMIKDEKV